jgi:surfeit locus 1 family protein
VKRSRAVVFLAALSLALLTARLGFWQLDRAAQKNAVQSAIDTRRSLPPLAPDALARTLAEADQQHYRAIEIDGRWLPEHTVYLDNRPMANRVGFIVVTPLALADGTAVLVQRGWLPRDALDRTKVAAPLVGADPVRVAGRIAPPPGRLYEFDGAASGPIRQNIDVAAFARETRLSLRPLSIQSLDRAGAPSDGLLRDWPLPAATVHKHYGYAFQWFALSALTIGLYVWFQLIRPRRP